MSLTLRTYQFMFLNQLFYIQNINSYQNLDLLSFFLFIFFIINTFNDNNHIRYFPWFSYFGLINCFYFFIWLSKFRAASLNDLRNCVFALYVCGYHYYQSAISMHSFEKLDFDFSVFSMFLSLCCILNFDAILIDFITFIWIIA